MSSAAATARTCWSCRYSRSDERLGLRCERSGFGASRLCSGYEYEPGTDEIVRTEEKRSEA